MKGSPPIRRARSLGVAVGQQLTQGRGECRGRKICRIRSGLQFFPEGLDRLYATGNAPVLVELDHVLAADGCVGSLQ